MSCSKWFLKFLVTFYRSTKLIARQKYLFAHTFLFWYTLSKLCLVSCCFTSNLYCNYCLKDMLNLKSILLPKEVTKMRSFGWCRWGCFRQSWYSSFSGPSHEFHEHLCSCVSVNICKAYEQVAKNRKQTNILQWGKG